MYFYVTVNYTAVDFLKKLRYAATKTGKDALKTEKLAAEYYLVPFELMKFNFNYEMKLLRSEIYRVDRWVAPRINRFKVFIRRTACRIHDGLHRYTNHECGEALLVCAAYLELCRDRIDAISVKAKDKETALTE